MSTANLTIVLNNQDQGLTRPEPGTHPVALETPVEVLASPKVGYVFSAWQLSGAGTIDDLNNPSANVTLTGDAVLTPLFKPEVQLTILTSPPTCGSTVPMQEKIHPFGQGDTVNLSAAPGTGYYFVEWLEEEGCSIADPTSASTTATVSATCQITARFEEDLVKFAGIVAASGYKAENNGNMVTAVRLLWPEAESPFSSSPEEITYHVYCDESSDPEIIYQPKNLIKSLQGITETEITIPFVGQETFFLVVAEDMQGNRNRSRKVVSVIPSAFVFVDGEPPMDLEEIGADQITISTADKTVTLHGGDWRYLFPTGKVISLWGNDPDPFKKVSSVRFDGRNTTIRYNDTQYGEVVESGRFRSAVASPDLNQLRVQTLRSILDRRDLPPVFVSELESLKKSNSSAYVNPSGTILVMESRADGTTISRDRPFQNTISLGKLGDLDYLVDLSLGVENDLQTQNGEVEYFKIVIKGTARVQGVANITLNSETSQTWEQERLIEKKIVLTYRIGKIPVYQEIEFWMDGRLVFDVKKESNFEATVGVKLEKGIDIGFEYTCDSGWSTIFNSGHSTHVPFTMKGSASTDAKLFLTPHILTRFYKSATAEATLYSIAHLFSDFEAEDSNIYLTRCDLNANAYMRIDCDFTAFGELLAAATDSLWLFNSRVYSLPKLEIENFMSQPIFVSEDTEPHYLDFCCCIKSEDGVGNRIYKLAHAIDKWVPEEQKWERTYEAPKRLKLYYPITELVPESRPYLYRYDEWADLYVDRLFPHGSYRISVWATPHGVLGPLDTRRATTEFRVAKYEEPGRGGRIAPKNGWAAHR